MNVDVFEGIDAANVDNSGSFGFVRLLVQGIERWMPEGNYEEITIAVASTDPSAANTNPEIMHDGSSLFTGESDTAPTWNSGAPVNSTVTSIADSSSGYGDFVTRVEADATTFSYVRPAAPITNGQVYEWHLLYKIVSNGNNPTLAWAGGTTTATTLNTDGAWHLVSGTFTATETGNAQMIIANSQSGASADTDELRYKASFKLQ